MPADQANTLEHLLKNGAQTLHQYVSNAYSEALILLQHASGKRKEYLIAHSDETADNTTLHSFQHYIDRRIKGEPIAYILQEKEFWSLPLQVTPQVLIPRPETELLVEAALECLKTQPQATILDLGTGSGCIALAIATEYPETNIVATDISQQSLNIAISNAKKLNISNITFICSDWFQAVTHDGFDLVVSNPPYISKEDEHLEDNVRSFEPNIALFSDDNGMQALTHIIQHAPNKLHVGGQLILEHGWQQANEVNEQLLNHGFQKIQNHRDLQGHTRVTTSSLCL